MQGHVCDLTDSELIVGDNLRSALEQGDRHEVFVNACKQVVLFDS